MLPNVCIETTFDAADRLEHVLQFEEHNTHAPATLIYPAGQVGTQPTPLRTSTEGATQAVHEAGAPDVQAAQFDEQAPMMLVELQKLAKHRIGTDDPRGQ